MNNGQKLIYTKTIGLKTRAISLYWSASLYFSGYSNKKLKKLVFQIFLYKLAVKRLVYSYWLLDCHPFMNSSGNIPWFYHNSGNILWFMQFLNIMEKGFIGAKSHIFIILIDMSPCLCALLVSSDLINVAILWLKWRQLTVCF